MILEVNDIYKKFGNRVVLDSINLEIKKPRLIALIAPNGSGKSTLFNIICNIEKANVGNVLVFSKKNSDFKIFKELTYLQDNSVLYQELSGIQHIQLILDSYSLPKATAKAVIDKLKMTGYIRKKVKYYSLGMKQHLLLAMAILPKPKLLLLDEPLNGLDPASVIRIREILKDMHSQGCTIILSSHNLEQIEKITNDILFIKNGQLLTREEIDVTGGNKVVITSLEWSKILELAASKSLIANRVSENKVLISCKDHEYSELSGLFLNQSIDIIDIEIEEEGLEDIYLKLFEDYSYETT